ncbi:MAG: hypothetical protein D6679_02795 [Candidatus Hydrogenedentota bacterium]|nr:MAG: hypothetical protein D6679_02795 [Candidatus Hydrogenedentota bacterium]
MVRVHYRPDKKAPNEPDAGNLKSKANGLDEKPRARWFFLLLSSFFFHLARIPRFFAARVIF